VKPLKDPRDAQKRTRKFKKNDSLADHLGRDQTQLKWFLSSGPPGPKKRRPDAGGDKREKKGLLG